MLGSGAGLESCARVCPGVEVGSWVGLTSSTIAEHGAARVQLYFVYNAMGSGGGVMCEGVPRGGGGVMGGVEHRPQLLNTKLPVFSFPLCTPRWGYKGGLGHARGCAQGLRRGDGWD